MEIYKKNSVPILIGLFFILAVLQWGYFAGKEDKEKNFIKIELCE